MSASHFPSRLFQWLFAGRNFRYPVFVSAIAVLVLTCPFFPEYRASAGSLDTVGFVSMTEPSSSGFIESVRIMNNSPNVYCSLFYSKLIEFVFSKDGVMKCYSLSVGRDQIIAIAYFVFFDVEPFYTFVDREGGINDPPNILSYNVPGIANENFRYAFFSMREPTKTSRFYSNKGSLDYLVCFNLSAEMRSLLERGICGGSSRLVSADQKPDLDGGDANQRTRENRKNHREEGDSILRRPLPERVKWVILSGFPLGTSGMLLVAWLLGWLGNLDSKERGDDRPRDRDDS